jgi:putative ABC transport system permease protein
MSATETLDLVIDVEPTSVRELGAPLVPSIPRANRFRASDLVFEATTDIGSRPGRLIMTVLGTVLGIGALVATFAFSQTASRQIANMFTANAATTVSVTPNSSNMWGQQVATASLPWDSVERVVRLNGVENAMLMGRANLGSDSITTLPINDPSVAASVSPPLIGATAGIVDVIGAEIVTGRMFDAGHEQRADRVAVIGARAAVRLGINRVDSQPSIFIGEVPYSVIGIFDNAARRGDLQDAVVIPLASARADFNVNAAEELIINIAPGAGPVVGAQAPIALSPNQPDGFRVSAPSGGSQLASDVNTEINSVLLILGGVVLLAGGVGIANVTMLSVMERTPEIGLRRAVGATRRQIATQFMVESLVIGLLGGLIGSSLGVLAVVGVSIVRGWDPVADPMLAIGGALLGAAVGLLAGWFPARRAARIEPVDALRAG